VRDESFVLQLGGDEDLFDLGDELCERLVVVDVRLYDRDERLGTERSETGMEIMTALAEVRVARVAEGQHREIDGIELWSICRSKRGVKGGGVVRRFAIAVGGGDDEHIFRGAEVVGRDFRHVAKGRGVTLCSEGLAEFFAEYLGISSLGTPEDRHRQAGRDWSRYRRCGCGGGPGIQGGVERVEIALEPHFLGT
jgi:hypothetical protein